MLQVDSVAGKDGTNVRIMSYNILADLLVSRCLSGDVLSACPEGWNPCHKMHLNESVTILADITDTYGHTTVLLVPVIRYMPFFAGARACR